WSVTCKRKAAPGTAMARTPAMGRRRKPPAGARAICGWLNVDKPAGVSSAAAVARLRGALKPKRIGHGGTLDPLASGVLPVALGEATKTVPYLMAGRKRYRFTVCFGERRDTDDAEGAVIETSDERPDDAAIRGVLDRFSGDIRQVPPVYSALKQDGRRAYDRARKGEAVNLAPRIVRVYELRFTDRPDDDHAVFEVECGQGFYIRALTRDLAAALGTVGYTSQLRRTRVGPFSEETAIPLENLAAMGHSARALKDLYPVETVLDDIPALAVTGDQAAAMRQGRPIKVQCTGGPGPREAGAIAVSPKLSDGTVVCAMENGTLVALARYHAGQIRPVRVLNI
ncbi:MAG TPA: tRNA pseudouridine(55) synthase TruB, partial [Alphaproteobacteria bacterium]|nr:tRNA pseudouridine(55) synthase TruB [Alphaproteobacteria bacterium]